MNEEHFEQVMAQAKKNLACAMIDHAGGTGVIHDFAIALERIEDHDTLITEMNQLKQAASHVDITRSFNNGRCVWAFAWSVHQAMALLELGVSIEATDQVDPIGVSPALTPLGVAVLQCNVEMVMFFLAHQANAYALAGKFRVFELCENEAQEAFGMKMDTHEGAQRETREFLRPWREHFEISQATHLGDQRNEKDKRL